MTDLGTTILLADIAGNFSMWAVCASFSCGLAGLMFMAAQDGVNPISNRFFILCAVISMLNIIVPSEGALYATAAAELNAQPSNGAYHDALDSWVKERMSGPFGRHP